MVCHVVARRRRRKVRVSKFDLRAFDTVKEWCEAAQLSTLSSPDPLTGRRIASGDDGAVSARSRREVQKDLSSRSYRPCRGDQAVASSVFIPIREYLASAAALEAYVMGTVARTREGVRNTSGIAVMTPPGAPGGLGDA